jgi:hypothetical protein
VPSRPGATRGLGVASGSSRRSTWASSTRRDRDDALCRLRDGVPDHPDGAPRRHPPDDLHTEGGPLQWGLLPHGEFPQAFRDVGADPENKVVILTGTGNVFSRPQATGGTGMRAADLRRLFGRHVTQARQVVRQLLKGRLVCQPFEDAEARGYHFSAGSLALAGHGHWRLPITSDRIEFSTLTMEAPPSKSWLARSLSPLHLVACAGRGPLDGEPGRWRPG